MTFFKKYILILSEVMIPICFSSTSASCVYRNRHSFRIVPQAPNYLLRAPDARSIPFPDILRYYNSYQPGRSWMELQLKLPLLPGDHVFWK